MRLLRVYCNASVSQHYLCAHPHQLRVLVHIELNAEEVNELRSLHVSTPPHHYDGYEIYRLNNLGESPLFQALLEQTTFELTSYQVDGVSPDEVSRLLSEALRHTLDSQIATALRGSALATLRVHAFVAAVAAC
jgi:hypothetical protein